MSAGPQPAPEDAVAPSEPLAAAAPSESALPVVAALGTATLETGADETKALASNLASGPALDLAPGLAPGLASGRRPTAVLVEGARVLAVAFVLYVLFFNLSVVRGNSMSPGIHDGDRILVEPWSYLVGDVSRGDVVVLQYPLDPRVDYIKRVIGLPGDRIVLADGHLWVNGELLTEPYVADVDRSSYLSCVVDDDSVFVLGDNRPRSSDSREFGLVPIELLRGRVDFRLWPLSRAGWIR